jgi:hypothetical protein
MPPKSIKAVVTRASDHNNEIERAAFIELDDLDSLRTLLMQVEIPVVMYFAPEEHAPAEIEIIIYDDTIES